MTVQDDQAQPVPRRGVSRRTLLTAGAVGGLSVTGVGALLLAGREPARSPVGPDSRLVAVAEQARSRTGRTVSMQLRAAPGTVDLAGRTTQTWLYDDRLPGTEIRAAVGDLVTVRLRNDLPAPTSIHWHGLALRNDMDGVPDMTQEQIPAGADFTYSFVAPHPGTYFFHPHTGLQLDRGLYAPLVIEDPSEPAVADVEHVLVLDDWLDGLGRTPDDAFAELRAGGMEMGGSGGGMGGMDMGGGGATSPDEPLGADTGDVVYPLHLINGRPAADAPVLAARPGQRVRLRLINAAGDTAYRVAVGGHRLTVTHADGFPVRPVEVDALLIGMGERYDVVVTAQDGAFPLVAVPEGKDDQPAARAVLRTGTAATPPASARPAELDRRLLTYEDLRPAPSAVLPPRTPDRVLPLVLGEDMATYTWKINRRTGDRALPLDVRGGERVRLSFRNETSMFHPMHVHGHTFALVGSGLRKDTVNVLPGQTLDVDLEADNPGQWMVHCHNAYHLEGGMSTRLSYVT